jgi:hypothetical protein
MNASFKTEQCEPTVMNIGRLGSLGKEWVIICSKHGRVAGVPFSPFELQTDGVRRWYREKWDEHLAKMETLKKTEPEIEWELGCLPVHLL